MLVLLFAFYILISTYTCAVPYLSYVGCRSDGWYGHARVVRSLSGWYSACVGGAGLVWVVWGCHIVCMAHGLLRLCTYKVVGTQNIVFLNATGTMYPLYIRTFTNVKFLFSLYIDKDYICIQSMDGTLSVYEQESFSFTRFLPDSMLPGPLAYVAASDSFVTVSSARTIESYKYVYIYISVCHGI